MDQIAQNLALPKKTGKKELSKETQEKLKAMGVIIPGKTQLPVAHLCSPSLCTLSSPLMFLFFSKVCNFSRFDMSLRIIYSCLSTSFIPASLVLSIVLSITLGATIKPIKKAVPKKKEPSKKKPQRNDSSALKMLMETLDEAGAAKTEGVYEL